MKSPGRIGEVTLDGVRTRLESLGYAVSFHVYAPGTRFAAYHVSLDRADAVLSGRLGLQVDGGFSELGPGDWLEISRGCLLAVEVVGDQPVLALDGVRLGEAR
ncbi:MAG: hypothetical protein P8080_01755 [Gammaproteobacteria bacterium]